MWGLQCGGPAAAFGQIGPLVWEAPAQTDWKMVGWQSLAAIATGFGTAVLASGILPVLENLFASRRIFRGWKWRTSTIRYSDA